MKISLLKDKITDANILRKRHIFREGYVFSSITEPANVYDAIVIKYPQNIESPLSLIEGSQHSLEEQINFVNEHKLEKALIITEDINFITQCPTLKHVTIFPADSALNGFDYSPLYLMPEIKDLNCHTVYGKQEELSTVIDYSKINGLVELAIYGKGHLKYESVELEDLWVSGFNAKKTIGDLNKGTRLKKLTLLQTGIETCDGVERFKDLQYLDLSYNRKLRDISELRKVAKSLRLLSIENCPKITDFSCLEELTNLEHLQLLGANELPNLDFLKNMPKLKTFSFSMRVLDGDLSLCLQVPYVYSKKNRKEYNLKDKDLPKKIPDKPFALF